MQNDDDEIINRKILTDDEVAEKKILADLLNLEIIIDTNTTIDL
jgi:hypothetical protein